MTILTRSLAALAFAVASTAHAQPKTPDFSGDWTLNSTKSDLGGIPAPSGMAAKIVQTPGEMQLTQSVGAQGATQHIPLGPKDSTWNAPDGQPATSNSAWTGDTLVVNTKLQRQGMDITLVSRWSMSPDGKTLTLAQQTATPMGAMSTTLVFDRK